MINWNKLSIKKTKIKNISLIYTTYLSSLSTLFPIRNIFISGLAIDRNSFSQSSIELKVFSLWNLEMNIMLS